MSKDGSSESHSNSSDEEEQPRNESVERKSVSVKIERASSSDTRGLERGAYWLDSNRKRRVQVEKYKGTVYIDLRQMYEGRGGFVPGKKGIALSVTEWNKLCSIADKVNSRVKGGGVRIDETSESQSNPSDDDEKPKSTQRRSRKESASNSDTRGLAPGAFWLDAKRQRRVQVEKYKGTTYVDIRQLYEGSKGLVPGKKGLALSVSEWRRLCALMDTIDEEVNAIRGRKTSTPRADTSASESQSDNQSRSPQRKSTSASPQRRKKSVSDNDERGLAPGAYWLDTKRKRRVQVERFKGELLVDLRQMYDSPEGYVPGKKGLSLSVTEWRRLCSLMDNIDADLSKRR